jgi:hypothetical protein
MHLFFPLFFAPSALNFTESPDGMRRWTGTADILGFLIPF